MKIKLSELRKIIRETLEEEQAMDEISWPWSSKDEEKHEDLPADYEECGECGFDHSYEPQEAFEAHRDMEDDFLTNIDVASDMSRSRQHRVR